MRSIRVMTALLLAGAGLAAAGSAANAADDGYGSYGSYGSEGSSGTPTSATSSCVDDVALLGYKYNGDASEVTITFVNPDGADVVYADQPASGTVLWPGMEVSSDGAGEDWPGWTKNEDGTWVRGDSYDWAAETVQVIITADADTVTTSTYPNAVSCSPAGVPRTGALAATGGDLVLPLSIAAGLVLVGGVAVLATRRRRA
jgi:LPXTG-motif cell wall-anchored protein